MELLTALAVAVSLGIPQRTNANVSIAAQGAFVAVVWSASSSDGGTDIYAAVSRDGGASFLPHTRVNATPGDARVNGEQPPRVVLRRQRGAPPAIVVIWTVKRDAGTQLLTAESRDGGRTFAESPIAGSRAAGNRGWESIAVDAKGDVYALWLDHRELARQETPPPAQHHGHDSSAGAKRDGVAMAQLSKLYVSRVGTPADPHVVTGGVCYCCKTAIAARPDGTMFAAWRHVYAGNIRDIAFSTLAEGGTRSSPPVRVSSDEWALDGCPDDGPAMVVDAAGVAHVVWPTLLNRPEPHKAIFYSWTEDGRTFVPRVRVSPEGRNAAHPQVVVDTDGVTVLWDEVVDGSRRVFARRRSRSQKNFAPVMLSDEGVSATYPAAAVSSDAIVVAWSESTGGASRIAVRRIPQR